MSGAVAMLVARSGDLKREVFEFARHPRFERVFRQAVRAHFGGIIVGDEPEIENFYDWFIQQYRLHDGSTIVDRFLERRADLTEPEREFLAGWRDVREGTFEVVGRDGDALLTENPIDELAYRIHANVGPKIFDRMPVGSFLVTRVVPVQDEWLISGASRVYPAAQRDVVFAAAALVAVERPKLSFQNPRLLARGWELQQAQHDAFVRHFGADEITVEAGVASKLMLEFYRALGASDSFTLEGDAWSDGGAETMGIIYDVRRGLGLYVDYALAQAAFADPDLMRHRRYKETIRSYFLDDSVDPVPLERLAGRHPDTASRVIRAAFGKPGLSWERDGERLMRQYKRTWYERPVLPSVSVISDRLAPFLNHNRVR